jgi:hypothetical protein
LDRDKRSKKHPPVPVVEHKCSFHKCHRWWCTTCLQVKPSDNGLISPPKVSAELLNKPCLRVCPSQHQILLGCSLAAQMIKQPACNP